MPIIVGAIIILAAIAGTLFYTNTPKAPVSTNAEQKVETTATDPAPTNTSSAIAAAYKDGTYSATGEYRSPAGQETVDITLTLTGGTVTAATFVGHAQNPGSINNQEKFKNGFQALVVGKPIDSIALNVVNGSSLTPKGFMDALKKVEAEAKVQ